jgi:hypothetical protein
VLEEDRLLIEERCDVDLSPISGVEGMLLIEEVWKSPLLLEVLRKKKDTDFVVLNEEEDRWSVRRCVHF